MTAAGKLAKVTGHRLSREQKKKAGPVVHYGFGTAVGGLYGLAYEFAPRSVKGLHPGSGYGTALFVGADEGRSTCLWPFTICKRSSTECAFVRTGIPPRLRTDTGNGPQDRAPEPLSVDLIGSVFTARPQGTFLRIALQPLCTGGITPSFN